MKITTQKELNDLIATADKSNTILLMEDLEITFDCEITCNLKAENIDAHKINAHNINAHNINAHKINAHKIDARNIDAINIDADNINAHNIDARNIDARNIDAINISYFAFCIAYESLKCKSISGTRENSIHKCLDQEIEYIKDEKIQIELTKAQLDKIKHLIN